MADCRYETHEQKQSLRSFEKLNRNALITIFLFIGKIMTSLIIATGFKQFSVYTLTSKRVEVELISSEYIRITLKLI